MRTDMHVLMDVLKRFGDKKFTGTQLAERLHLALSARDVREQRNHDRIMNEVMGPHGQG